MKKHLLVILNFLIFLPGFLCGILDNSVPIYLYEKLVSMNIYLFWLAYFIMIYILYKNASFFIRFIDYIKIKQDNNYIENIKRFFRIALISGYLGYMVNTSTVFAIASFSFLGSK